jgi:Tfp pilus assembly protein PilP
MNVTKTISIVMLAAAMSWAQSAPTGTAATAKKPATKAAASAKPASQMAPSAMKNTTAKPAAKTPPANAPVAKAPMSKAPMAKAPMKSAASTAATKAAAPKTTVAKKSKPAKPAATAKAAVKPASATPTQRAESLTKPIGKRDPFVSVIVARSDSSAACTGGKRCLVIDQLALRGIVRTPTKWIALVENPAKKTYYLYENDPIFNAVVVRITGDSVIFRESVMDALGHSTEREVVKRVNAPAI